MVDVLVLNSSVQDMNSYTAYTGDFSIVTLFGKDDCMKMAYYWAIDFSNNIYLKFRVFNSQRIKSTVRLVRGENETIIPFF